MKFTEGAFKNWGYEMAKENLVLSIMKGGRGNLKILVLVKKLLLKI